MDAKELLDAGRLSAALDQVSQDVKAHPADSRLRTFLFELLCFSGDYQRAERQLDVIAQQDTNIEIGVQIYRNVLVAERARERLYSDGLKPNFLVEPPPFASLHLEAINRLREGRSAEARALLEKSARMQTALPGRLNGEAFPDLCDGDPILGPFLEIIINDKYGWLPLSHLKRATIIAAKRLRDLMWLPATLELAGGSPVAAFIPVLYSGSARRADERVKLGRMTEWIDAGDGLSRGVGQRLLFVGDDEKAILEVRDLELVTNTDLPS